MGRLKFLSSWRRRSPWLCGFSLEQ